MHRLSKGGLDSSGLVFSPDGETVAVRGGDVTVLDTVTGNKLHRLEALNAIAAADKIVFSPDGKKILTLYDRYGFNQGVQVWNAESGKKLYELGINDTFSLDGKKMIVANKESVCVYDSNTGMELHKLSKGNLGSPVFSHDEKKVIITRGRRNSGDSGGLFEIWDVETGRKLQEFDKNEEALKFSLADKMFATVREGSVVRLWDWGVIDKQLTEAFVNHIAEERRVAAEKQKAEEQRAAEARQAEEEKLLAEEERIAERKVLLAGAVDLKEALHKSGFRQLRDYVLFGSVALQNNLRKADAFDKASAEANMKAATAEIAKNTFVGEYAYMTSNVEIEGNKSSFMMTIPTGFICTRINEMLFPMSDVTGKLNSNGRHATSLMSNDHALLVGEDSIVNVIRYANDRAGNYRPRDGGRMPDDLTRDASEHVILYARYANPSIIVLTVKGSTDSIKEFVRNSGNYQARLRFRNLQYSSSTENVKYWRVSTTDGKTEVPGGEYPNPFVVDRKGTIETITADVLKIEIVKVK